MSRDLIHHVSELNGNLAPVRRELTLALRLSECIADYPVLFENVLGKNGEFKPVLERGIFREHPAETVLNDLCVDGGGEERGVSALMNLVDLLVKLGEEPELLGRITTAIGSSSVQGEGTQRSRARHTQTLQEIAKFSIGAQHFKEMRDALTSGLEGLGFSETTGRSADESVSSSVAAAVLTNSR